jgi:cobalt-zinc-cadmium efflux system membrane fusion protein
MMTSIDSRPGHRPGKAQALAIAAVIVAGVVLGALILLIEPGHPIGDDDDGAAPLAAASVSTAAGATGARQQVAMSDAQVKASGIGIETAGPARIASVGRFPAEIQLNDERTAHVVPRVAGIAESVLVSTGQTVRKGQLLAVFSSQLISDQRSALQMATKRLDHARSIFEREKRLWEQRITAEQDYLQAQHTVQEAEIDVENARQKLAALGVTGSERGFNRFELYAPYDGLVVERNLSVGEAVKEDTPIFTIADMRTVWAEVHIPAKDLPLVNVGDKVALQATAFDARTTGTVAFIGALVGEQTRMAKARVVVENPKGLWRPGLFVNVEVRAVDTEVPLTIDAEALQTLGTQEVVFVRQGEGFKAHPVTTGRGDGRRIEILQGLAVGDRYAARGSYIIKSELSKLSSEEGY